MYLRNFAFRDNATTKKMNFVIVIYQHKRSHWTTERMKKNFDYQPKQRCWKIVLSKLSDHLESSEPSNQKDHKGAVLFVYQNNFQVRVFHVFKPNLFILNK